MLDTKCSPHPSPSPPRLIYLSLDIEGKRHKKTTRRDNFVPAKVWKENLKSLRTQPHNHNHILLVSPLSSHNSTISIWTDIYHLLCKIK